MTVQGECEKSGWRFDDTGGHVVVGWKNVTLDDTYYEWESDRR